jgi:hypothetical protein
MIYDLVEWSFHQEILRLDALVKCFLRRWQRLMNIWKR